MMNNVQANGGIYSPGISLPIYHPWTVVAAREQVQTGRARSRSKSSTLLQVDRGNLKRKADRVSESARHTININQYNSTNNA